MKSIAVGTAVARLAPIAGSAALHVAVYATSIGGHGSQAPAALPANVATQLDVIDIQTQDEPPVSSLVSPAPASPQPAELRHTHTHAYPGSGGARLHDASLVHLPIADAAAPASTSAPVLAAPPQAETVRFAITLGKAQPGPPRTAGVGAGGSADSGTAQPIVPETRVSIPARLQVAPPALYPLAARSAEIEADVAVTLIVGTDGNVQEAALLRPMGYGFDEAALSAVRKYRFSPARLNGQAVRVRMRWVVQFRLK